MKHEYTSPCPVCGADMTEEVWRSEGYTEESRTFCPNGCYINDWAYGSGHIIVGDKVWGYWYGDSEEEREKMKREIAKAIEEEKAKLQVGGA